MSAANTNGNGKWQLAFWIITFISTVGFVGVVSSLVSNDRIRAEEDGKIRDKIECYQRDIIQRLARIETKIETVK